MSRRLTLISRALLIALLLSLSIGGALSGSPFASAQQASTESEKLLHDVQFLSSPQLTGRGVDTPGVRLAGDYLATEFGRAGLQPGGDHNGFFQPFDVPIGVTVNQPSSLALDHQTPLKLNEQWTPLGLSTSDKIAAEVVFAGYGITAKDSGYDDYADLNVKNKIVLVLRYEPPPRDDKSQFKRPPDYSRYAALRTKANNARDHGAAGMILVDLNHDGNDRPELLSTKNSLWRGGNSLVAAQITRDVVERWAKVRGISLQELKKQIDSTGKPASMPIPGASAELQVNLTEDRQQTANIVGILPGSDPLLKNERVVIGAHYDHLGFGHFGALDPQAEGQIHPGADDNASGTAVMLEVARRLTKLPVKPARTVIFVAFSGEELGLYGSRYYVNHADSIPSVKAMINLDMVGRLRENRLTVFGARSGERLSSLVRRDARQLGLDVTESNDIGRSDHMSFYVKKIPVIHFFTGNHSDYHRATDTWDKLNIEGMAKISDLVLATALDIASAREPIPFVSLPSQPRGAVAATAPKLRVYLGTIPDYGAAAVGVRLAGVSSGSPAALAGLHEGDVIVRLGDKEIQNIEDLADALQAHKSGDQVSVVVLRAGAPLTVKATLRTRG